MKKNDVSRCRKCNKVIVGSSKLGLCDSCFSKEGAKAAAAAGASAVAFKNREKIKGFVGNIIKALRGLKK